MKVLCIDNIGGNKQFNLTIGKIYDIISDYGDSYLIMNDIGELVDYTAWRFKTLEDHRDRILNDLFKLK